jgi:hypothetical protein
MTTESKADQKATKVSGHLKRGVSLPDARLERLSDCVRRGEPIDFGEALEVITYQELLKNRKTSLWQKIQAWWAN